jgi:soluble lytic murein transglycosylase-like protein
VRFAAPVALCGVVLAVSTTSVPTVFAPPKGPPDTLRHTGVALHGPSGLLRTRYLERAISTRSPREALIAELAARYNITEPLARSIHDAAIAAGVDPELGFRLIRVESVFEAKVIGPGGALGLTQLMPGTARDLDSTVHTVADILEPRTNLRLGFGNLRAMIERYEGDVRLGVLAYNRGERAVDRALKRGADPENGYSIRVLGPRAHGGRPYAGPGLLRP